MLQQADNLEGRTEWNLCIGWRGSQLFRKMGPVKWRWREQFENSRTGKLADWLRQLDAGSAAQTTTSTLRREE